MSFYDDLNEQVNYSAIDKHIAEYILNNAQHIININITEFAQRAFVSTSSIVKFCKKNGFKGYIDMKIAISLELGRYIHRQNNISLELPITSSTKDEEIHHIVFDMYNQTLLNSFHSIDTQTIKKAANLIFHSDYISMFGSGDSKLLAEDLLSKLRSINLPTDNSVTSSASGGIYRNKLTKNPVAIVFSEYANTPRVYAWLNQLIKLDYNIILITSNKVISNQHILKIYTDTQENRDLRVANFSSRLAVSYIIDVLFLYIFKLDYHKHYNYSIENKKNQKHIIDKFKVM